MITLEVLDRLPLLSTLEGEPSPRVKLKPLGQRIVDVELGKINHFYPNVEVWKIVVMPDHVHMIVYVRTDFEDKKSLGVVIKGFKSGCTQAAREILASPEISLFRAGYNDKIRVNSEMLDRWKNYLDDNPRRLWIKRTVPDYFKVWHDQNVEGTRCQLIGNLFLLDYPDKEAVIVHRHYSDADFEKYRRRWLGCGERGGVLVSASVAPREREVMREAWNHGYRIILLRENGFHRYYKPGGASFDACARGQLLQVSPWEYHTEKRTISRDQCLFLNNLAERIAYGPDRPRT